MTRILKALGATVVLTATTGCLSVDKIDRAISASERAADYATLDRRISSLQAVPESQMPTRGTADFDGMGRLEIDPQNGSSMLRIIGDVALTADFGAGTVDGTMTGMRGVSGTSLSNTKFFDVAGDIAIGANSSGIGEALDGGPAGASAWHADFAGRLDTDVRGVFVVRGDLAGDFVGSGSLAGIQGSDRNAIVTRNSSQGSMSLEISATR